ncbi:MAG: hypothetical protein KatS3mg087_1035 [Patescibacteria group bacterium]|nr:MAG: hypothetical protein KatS3mg087_1035 [Patescibacteria group bacterium]
MEAVRPIIRMVELCTLTLYWQDSLNPQLWILLFILSIYAGVAVGVLETYLNSSSRR